MLTLLQGMLRELVSREERKIFSSPKEIFAEVEEIWKHVAHKHPELDPDGLRNYIEGEEPRIAQYI